MSARQSAGGRARQAQIRAVLGEKGYRRYQQALARAGGVARQAQLRASLGEANYCAYQRTLYQRAIQKHGATRMRKVLTDAHERRRCWRIGKPTPAEQLLQWLALEAGLTLHADLTGTFEWTRWRSEPGPWHLTATVCTRPSIQGLIVGSPCSAGCARLILPPSELLRLFPSRRASPAPTALPPTWLRAATVPTSRQSGWFGVPRFRRKPKGTQMARFTSANAAEHGRRGGQQSHLWNAKGKRQKVKSGTLVGFLPFIFCLLPSQGGGR